MEVLGNLGKLVSGGKYAWEVLVPSRSSITRPLYRAYDLVQLIARMRFDDLPGAEQVTFFKLLEFKQAVAEAIMAKGILKDILKPGQLKVAVPKGIDFSNGGTTKVTVSCVATRDIYQLAITHRNGSFWAN